MRHHAILAVLLLFVSSLLYSQHNIIPAPVSYSASGATVDLSSGVSISLPSELSAMKNFVDGVFTNHDIATNGNVVVSFVLNKKADPAIGEEGYTLNAAPEGITVTANTPAGAFYGVQTLRQLIGDKQIEACTITDYPRFEWRGLMLDVSRHFFTKEEVMQYIDLMAEYKFNVFHWHLTDDNGWRIEIKSRPKLTEVGAWRVERVGYFNSRKDPQPGEPTPYGGFYTHEDIREVVQYAKDRQITIVPEIDVPGHSMAALAAYPELSTLKEPKFVNPGTAFSEWYGNGEFKMLIENTLNPADEEVFKFLDDVFTEVAMLFPGEYIHAGGDECDHHFWLEDPANQKLMKKEKLETGEELQSYFMKRVEKIISSKGKKMIGWDEILEGGLAKGAAVMSWRGVKGGIEATQEGHKVVMSPTTHTYLDYTQGDRSVEVPIYASLSLQKTYEFEPVPEGAVEELVMGGQGNLWTEQIPTFRYALYMTYPRAFAVVESTWSPKEKKNWADFERRVEAHFDVFKQRDIPISTAVYEPIIRVKKEGDKLMCEISTVVPGADVYYSMDGTFPDSHGTKYTGPFEIPDARIWLRTATFREGEQLGRMLTLTREELAERVR
ncbi:beta-N-acetylhexosaminidase [Fulvivirga sedimenti]|uniref:beta-N-acetylhexosaminidase n=1 Tax=Fulvivirga sedimenti TaxID=2879465 RepID=A0A9X1KVK2_9BACT|nr:family 20 glycosylhydrolase [Fulvivirga sedimenti]MCA6073790.1 family 20 glycosylhydrolase [Fulvivirga sedimenti]